MAVVDRVGQPRVMLRSEEATAQMLEMARRRAYTGRMFRGSTLEFQSRFRYPGAGGGVPIQVGDDTIGAVGSAGSNPETDDASAKAGVASVADLLREERWLLRAVGGNRAKFVGGK